MAFWNLLQAFGIFYGHFGELAVYLAHFSLLWYIVSRKIWQPCSFYAFVAFSPLGRSEIKETYF
jgi:hypothetical protein